MNPVASSNVLSSNTDLHTARSRAPCLQHLQPTRHFGSRSLRLCNKRQRRAQKQKFETCFVAAVEAPTTASSSDSLEELNTHDLYKRFDQLLTRYAYSYKQGDRVKGVVFRVDQRGAYVDIGAKAAAVCPSEECSLAGMARVPCLPLHSSRFAALFERNHQLLLPLLAGHTGA